MDGSGSIADTAAVALTNVDTPLECEFEALVTECATWTFRLAYSVLRHRQEAEDVAQEALAKACRNFRQLRDRERFRGWLARMTWRLALDRQRANRRRMVRDARVTPDADSTGPADLIAAERAVALWHAIDTLPEKLRLVIVLANIEEHDLSEVATLLGMPVGTVKSRLFEARRRLREQLQWLNE